MIIHLQLLISNPCTPYRNANLKGILKVYKSVKNITETYTLDDASNWLKNLYRKRYSDYFQ
jgi:hypothetical protein